MEFSSTAELSQKWKISPRRIAILCEKSRIPGVIKKGKTWLIPSNSVKPIDERSKKNPFEYSALEKNYKVIYPESENATYSSLLNYSDDLNKPFQRWYRYKEGYSIELVKHLIQKYNKNTSGIILDPFLGSGSTLLAAREMNLRGIGFEVNPFSRFLAQVKLDTYSDKEIDEFKHNYERIIQNKDYKGFKVKRPELSISQKVFEKTLEQYYLFLKSQFDRIRTTNPKVYNLLKLGWLACIERVSNYKKAGNGLKLKKYVKPKFLSVDDVTLLLLEEYQNMYIDIKRQRTSTKQVIYSNSCKDVPELISPQSISGIIFSPPYANCFDYTEIYKLELWYGDFVKNYADLKKLRNTSLHSHLNGNLKEEIQRKSETLEALLKRLNIDELWDKKIPQMLRLYYSDMFSVIDDCYNSLENNGFCAIVVGNSAYGGVVFPTDLILAEYAQKIGFIVDKIEVDRYIITSSQQYNMTKNDGKFLRESIVCLVKKK